MVYYFVIGADGQRYGPVDIDNLVQWTREGRIVASTELIERGTQRALLAGSITAIDAELRRQSNTPSPVSIERAASPSNQAPLPTRLGPANTTPSQDHSHPPPIPLPPRAVGADSPPPMFHTMPYARHPSVGSKSRIVAGLLGIFLGSLGVHRFYLGYTGIGLLQLIATLSTCGWGGIWGFVEGIVCLAGGMRDAAGRELRD